MAELAIIGGTGLTRLPAFIELRREAVETAWGRPSSDLIHGRLYGADIVFIARHGEQHTIPPHRINYRANIQALKDAGVGSIIAAAAVGGIRADLGPCKLCVPHQLIDYSHGRAGTFFEDDLAHVTHIDFSQPYTPALRERLLDAGVRAGLRVVDGGVYGCTQGPRLETPAEITRMERDGCDVVGMTGMPEAALAREAGLDYACCAVVANWAAGKTDRDISMAEIEDNLRLGMADLARLLQALLAPLA
ncbi:MAG: S-methyl-5'-thioinosine phosphorylase [Candidatus Methylumidiphilus sp.]